MGFNILNDEISFRVELKWVAKVPWILMCHKITHNDGSDLDKMGGFSCDKVIEMKWQQVLLG